MIPAVDLFKTYNQAGALLAAGDLRQAADLCRVILDSDPNFPYGHHLMSSLFYKTGSYERARIFSQKAIDLQPGVFLFHYEHGRVLFALEDYKAAISAFKKAHKLEPKNPLPLILWADSCARQMRIGEALALFSRARAARDIPEIDEHEALCHLQKGDIAKAEQMFDRVIERQPDYFYGYIHKGKILMDRKEDVAAEACFAKAIKLNPNAHEAFYRLALLSERQGQMDIAMRHIMQAIQINPQSMQSQTFLGSLLLGQKQFEAAEQILRQAHERNPNDAYVTQLLVLSLQRQSKFAEALKLVETALQSHPSSSVMQYFYAMASGKSLEIAPPKYISDLFDQYADRFDHHLQSMLHYEAPELLAAAIRNLSEVARKEPMRLLDLGCGTGLVAQALHGLVSQAVGVDLSEKMLKKAKSKQLYDELHQQDIIDFMQRCERSFDLITAADVLIYIGNLSPFFQAARAKLAPSGLLAFTIENEDVTTFHLSSTGRFSHSPHYIMQLAQAEGYTLAKQEEIILRIEGNIPVQGSLFIFKKSQSH